jgi:hypothetical protein
MSAIILLLMCPRQLLAVDSAIIVSHVDCAIPFYLVPAPGSIQPVVRRLYPLCTNFPEQRIRKTMPTWNVLFIQVPPLGIIDYYGHAALACATRLVCVSYEGPMKPSQSIFLHPTPK